MSNYGISVLITILATSLIAFYLLYKSRQLNLGIVISISVGSVFLGFTFKPIYSLILNLLSASINAKIALVISILAVLVIFLSLILIISYVASICIPKKIASIDCCTFIDKFVSGIKIKEGFAQIVHKVRNILDNVPVLIDKTKKYADTLKNKLKKPVDTKQIIDTMGIEKIEIQEPADDYNKVSEGENIQTESEVEDAVILVQDTYETNTLIIDSNEAETEAIEENTPLAEPSELDEVPDAVSIETQDSEKLEEVIDNEHNDTYLDLANTDVAAAMEVEQFIEEEEQVTDQTHADAEIDSSEDTVNSEYSYETENINEVAEIEETTAEAYILKAFESKDKGNKVEAVNHYFRALELEPDNDMIFWISLDICTLYKQLGMSDLATIILEGLVEEYGSVIKPEIKNEIMNNLKHS